MKNLEKRVGKLEQIVQSKLSRLSHDVWFRREDGFTSATRYRHNETLTLDEVLSLGGLGMVIEDGQVTFLEGGGTNDGSN
jgi:hypothetical protein